MTVSTINSVAEFVTNGVTTNFPFFFKFLEGKDLVVTYINPAGLGVPLTLGTHYTVSGAGNEKGGSITTTAVLGGPGKLFVSRVMSVYQQTSLRNQGKFLAGTHEDVFDRLTMLIQQTDAIFSRTIRSTDYETVPQLPPAVVRANRVMGFDSAGNPSTSNLTLEQLEQQPVLALESAAEAKTYAVEASSSADRSDEQADRSGELANRAGDFAVAAKDSAASSASSANIASAISNPFTNTADGIVATSGSGATNRFFSVPITSTSLAILYRNDAGVAVEIGRTPSSQAIEEISQLIVANPSINDLMEFTDGSEDRALLARFDKDGYWRPEKHEPAVRDVLKAIAVFDGSDDLITETDASEDKVLLRRVDRYGVNWGKWEGVFPARLEDAGALAASAHAAAAEALAAVSTGPWGKLKRLMQTSFVHGLNPVQRPTLGLTALVTTTLPEGLSKAINVGRNPEAFAFIGGTPILHGTWYGFKAVTRVNGTGNLGGNNSGLQWSVEVMVDAAAPAFRVLGNGDEFRFIVDGQYYSDEVITVPGNGANCWIQLPFAKRGVRRIRICGVGRFGGVAVGPTESAWHPGDADRLRVSFIGDSFTDGAQSTGPDRAWTTQMAYLCGISNPWSLGVGGTGYVSVGANLGNFGSEIRINDAIASNPDMLFFFGSVNDRQNTVAEIQAAALAAWRAYRLTFPSIPFVIIGCATPATGFPVDAIKVDNALADAFVAWGDSNANFVRVTTDPQGPWLFGTGYISSGPTTNGSGNNDVYMGRVGVIDGTHPNNDGHNYLARRMTQALYQIALSK